MRLLKKGTKKAALKPCPAELREVLEPLEMEVSGSEFGGFRVWGWVFEGFCQGFTGKGFEGRLGFKSFCWGLGVLLR